MKSVIFIFSIILFSITCIGQIAHQDTGKTNCNFYSGILTEKGLDSGTYVYATSDHYSYIEFALPHFGRYNAKYRVEKLSTDGVFIVTKTYLYSKSASYCFFAIDSTMAEKISIKKGGLQYLKKEGIYVEITSDESIIFYYISKYINKHNLQSNFQNFNPKSFAAWLKVKN